MTEDEYTRKLDELDRLLNDPEVSMQPDRIWSLLAELSARDCGVDAMGSHRGVSEPCMMQSVGG